MSSLGTEFPKEQERVRELLVEYEKMGAPGAFGAAALRNILKRADFAGCSGDVVAMLRSFKELEGCS